jgi:hypothetical protein
VHSLCIPHQGTSTLESKPHVLSLCSALAAAMWCEHTRRRPVCDLYITAEPSQTGEARDQSKGPAVLRHAQATKQPSLFVCSTGNDGSRGHLVERGHDGKSHRFRMEAPETAKVQLVICGEIVEVLGLVHGNTNTATGEPVERGGMSHSMSGGGARPYV